jgi:hypothetical protein
MTFVKRTERGLLQKYFESMRYHAMRANVLHEKICINLYTVYL